LDGAIWLLLGGDTLEEKKTIGYAFNYIAVSRSKLWPEKCLMIGDSITDFKAAICV